MKRRLTLDERARHLDNIIEKAGWRGMDSFWSGAIRQDDGESAIFARQLESIETRLFEVKYPEGHAIELVPLLTAIDPGAEKYTYRAFDYKGRMKRSANYDEDAPRADIQGLEVQTGIHSYRASYGYSIQDLRAAAMANLPLEMKRAEAARTVAMRELDLLLWFGDSEVNSTGLANNANVSLTSPITGSWDTATPQQILADAQKLVTATEISSKGVEKSDTLVLAISSYEILATTYIGNNTEWTVLNRLLEANKGLRVVKSFQLETADAGLTKPRAIAYTNDREKLEGLVPVEFESFPPIAKNMSFGIDCHMRCGGVAVRYPGSIAYMDSIHS